MNILFETFAPRVVDRIMSDPYYHTNYVYDHSNYVVLT